MPDDDRRLQTAMSTYDADSVTVRGNDLCDDLMGEADFGSVLYRLLSGSLPDEGETRVVNAILVSLMEHGMTPQAIAARLTLMPAPDPIQGALASGILGAGSRYTATMEQCSRALQRVTGGELEAGELVAEYRAAGDPFPGLGHPFHKPVDPRTDRLFNLAAAEGVAGEHVTLLEEIRADFAADLDGPLPINVTGAIGAVTADMGLSPEAAKGLALISRAGGLVGHIIEEKDTPIGPDIWQLVEDHLDYVGGAPE